MDSETATDADPLRWVVRDQLLGPASKLAYRHLWLQAKEAASAKIVITAGNLATACGCKTEQAAWKWIRQLEKHGLIAVADRDKRRGTVLLYVFRPFPGEPMQRPDPQRLLDFGPADQPPGNANLCGGEGSHANLDSGEGSRPKQPQDAEKTASVGRYANLHVGEGSPASLTKETRSSLVPKCQRDDQRFIDNEDLLAQHVDVAGVVHGVGPISGDLAAALGEFVKATNPAQQKVKIKQHIRQVCRRPDPVADWAAGAAADLVVFHGVPAERLQTVLGDVEAMRAAGTLRSAGRLFVAKLQSLLEESPYAAIRSPLRRKEPGEAEQDPS